MTGSEEVAWARIGAHQARAPDAAAWHRVESARTLASLLDAARGGPLEGWLSGLDAGAGVHRLEAQLRARWRERVAEVARWMPREWRDAVVWWSWLPDLPLLDALARGAPLAPGVADAILDEVRGAPPAPGSRFAPLAPAWHAGGGVAGAWLAEWRRRLPAQRDDGLAALERAVRRHFDTFRAMPPGSGAPQRAAFGCALRLVFRRATATPAAAFVFLAQRLLDAERLRGEVVRRAALPRVPLAS